MELPQGQDCRIVIYTNGNIKIKENLGNIFNRCQNTVENYHIVFSPLIKTL